MTAVTAGATARRRPSGRAKLFTITWQLSRPGTQNRAALVLPVITFAITTALLLTVIGGARMFYRVAITDPQLSIYLLLAGVAVVLLVVPLVSLGGSAARLSANRRDDRLATIRLLGGTPAQVAFVTVCEAACIAALGAVFGAGLYAVMMPVVGSVSFFGAPIGAAALWVGVLPLLGTLIAVVILATVSAAIGLRSVVISPLGVRAKSSAPRMHWVRVVVTVAVVAGAYVLMQNMAVFAEINGLTSMILVLVIGFGAALAALNLVGPWVISVVARIRLKRATKPAQLIAARGVLESPKALWRQVGGVSMISFVSVIAGSGLALANANADQLYGTLVTDMQTGITLTLVMSFLMVACSVGVNQASQILDRRDLYVGLDRLGTPRSVMESSRVGAVMVPLLTVVLGSVIVAGLLAFPLVGMSIVISPLTVLTLAGTIVLGMLLVRLGLLVSRPVLSKVLAEPERA